MPSKAKRTEWHAVALDMAIETSSMEVMLRNGKRQRRPIVRVVFRTASGKEFSGPRVTASLRRALENGAARGPWLRVRRA